MKNLLVFDFDHTVVEDNTDVEILKVLPTFDPSPYKQLYKDEGWTVYMDKIFEVFSANGLKKQDFEGVLRTMQLAPGMKDLFDYISKHLDVLECIIASDSNTWFIEFLLEHHGIAAIFNKTFTNTGKWEEETLRVEPYTRSHDCPKCPVNMCKSEIVVCERTGFKHVVYVGDGFNDLCPIKSLKTGDLGCPRNDFKLAKMIKKEQKDFHLLCWTTEGVMLDADLQFWTSASEIIPALEIVLNRTKDI